jgi:uncharacterized protein DUF6682
MNVGDIRRRIKAKVGDQAGSEITDTQLLDWINDGLGEIAKRTQQPQATATTVTVASQGAYSISTFSADVLRLRSVMCDGVLLQAISQEEADNSLPDREKSPQTATPEKFWVWADQLNLWPRPATAGLTLKIFYVKRPAAVAVDADVPGIPLHMHTDLLQYVWAQVLDTIGDLDRGEKQMDRFAGAAATAASDAEWPVRGTYPHVTIATDDTYGYF